ncbi:MAG: DUF86 domain-containing protein [Chloroflexi bacterium]|nr:DUF86 domain-containing protein [Chloroflexota bacterium]
MTPADMAVVQRKLAVITEALSLLRPIKDMSLEDYLHKIYERKATERILQTLVNAAIDVNTHLLVGAGLPPPVDYYQSFLDIAEKLGVLDRDLALRLAPSAGLRNRLVHEYDTLDDAIVHASLREVLDLYPQYVEAVLRYLARTGS